MDDAAAYRIPGRLKEINPFIAMEILEKAKQMELAGEKIIHFELGEPAGETPAAIKAAALQALGGGETGSGPAPKVISASPTPALWRSFRKGSCG